MENAVEALKMAGAVLIFVIAISIAILFFGRIRETVDTIVDYRDRETMYIDGDFYYKTTGTERTVGLETVIPSIFRAYTENYKIVFEGLDQPLYTKNQNVGSGIRRYTIDAETSDKYENVSLPNDEMKNEFLCGILYNDFKNNMSQDDFQKKYGVTLPPSTNLYKQLKNAKKITEYLGVYIQNNSNPDIPDSNKIEKRIITYKIEN